MAALGEALPPTARSGLMLFLRRGMWDGRKRALPLQARLESTFTHHRSLGKHVTSAQPSFTSLRQWR